MREMVLYQQNMQLLIKVHVLDAMLYEKPWLSLYLFFGAMYCVIFNSVASVPAIVMGYFIILYVENYLHFVENKTFNLGYKPLTIAEVFKALILNSTDEKGAKQLAFEPIRVEKRTKRRRGAKDDVEPGDDDENDEEIAPLDHREFPFADRDAYPKLSVEDSLAPGTTKGTLSISSLDKLVHCNRTALTCPINRKQAILEGCMDDSQCTTILRSELIAWVLAMKMVTTPSRRAIVTMKQS
jgi:hypothetical protein